MSAFQLCVDCIANITDFMVKIPNFTLFRRNNFEIVYFVYTVYAHLNQFGSFVHTHLPPLLRYVFGFYFFIVITFINFTRDMKVKFESFVLDIKCIRV